MRGIAVRIFHSWCEILFGNEYNSIHSDTVGFKARKILLAGRRSSVLVSTRT
jgi:hypothetical protein